MNWRDRLWLRLNRRPPKSYDSYIDALVTPVLAGFVLGMFVYAIQNAEFGKYTELTWRGLLILGIGFLLLLLAVVGIFAWCVHDHKLSGIYVAIVAQGRHNWEKKIARLTAQTTQTARATQKER